MQEIIAMARRMKQLQARKDEMDEEWKLIGAELDDLRLKQIPEAMAEAEIRNLTVEGVGRVQLALDCYASILPEKKLEAYEWLEENGYGAIVQPYAQPSTLKATIKQALKDGQEWPDELFKVQPFTRASIVKA